MSNEIKPIGILHADAKKVLRNWTVSNVEGTLVIEGRCLERIKAIEASQLQELLSPRDESHFGSGGMGSTRGPGRGRRLGRGRGGGTGRGMDRRGFWET
jgi:hypothetical protein